MFEYVSSSIGIVDPSNGDKLVTTDAHWQSHFTNMAIFSSDGVKKFEFTLKSYSVDEPHTWPDDKVSRLILLSAREFQPDGRSREVYDMHPDIERLIEWRHENAKSKTDFVAFEFVDERKKAR